MATKVEDLERDIAALQEQLRLARLDESGNGREVEEWRECFAREPSLHGPSGSLAFACEGDVFLLDYNHANDGIGHPPPRRLTTSGDCRMPRISPSGKEIAFTSCLSGTEQVYVMDVFGGQPKRITWFASGATVVRWESDLSILVVSYECRGALYEVPFIFRVTLAMGESPVVNTSPIAKGDFYSRNSAFTVIGRHTTDAHVGINWMHYGGGCRGQVWIQSTGTEGARAKFERIMRNLNIASPILHEKTLIFVADPSRNKPGNLFSLDLTFPDSTPKQLTFHEDFYVRNPTLCSLTNTLVYQLGGKIFSYHLDSNRAAQLHRFPFTSFSQSLAPRMLDDPMYYLSEVVLHPRGLNVACLVRGRVVQVRPFEGPSIYHGESDGRKRYVGLSYLRDERIAAFSLSDDPEKISLEIFPSRNNVQLLNEYNDTEWGEEYCEDSAKDLHTSTNLSSKEALSFPLSSLGKPHRVCPSPKEDMLAIINTRSELLLVRYNGEISEHGRSIKSAKHRVLVVDKADFEFGIEDVEFSKCGNLLTYTKKTSHLTSAIFAVRLDTDTPDIVQITATSAFKDYKACIDPSLRYIYFVSNRNPRCVRDEMYDSVAFTNSECIMLVVLREDVTTPFLQSEAYLKEENKGDDEDDEDEEEEEEEEEEESSDNGSAEESGKEDPLKQVRFENLYNAITELPLKSHVGYVFFDLIALDKNRLLYVRSKVLGTKNPLHADYDSDDDWDEKQVGDLICFYTFQRKQIVLRRGDVSGVQLSMDRSTLLISCLTDEQSEEIHYFPANFSEESDALASPEDDTDSEQVDPTNLSGSLKPQQFKGNTSLDERIALLISPEKEWPQMFAEIWSATVEQNQTAGRSDHSPTIEKYRQYHALLRNIHSRSDFYDLVVESLAEHGVSHLYTADGDFSIAGKTPIYNAEVGKLGVDGIYLRSGGFKVSNVVQGNSWSLVSSGPLAFPAILKEDDIILSINNIPVSRSRSLDEILVGQVGKEVLIQFSPGGNEEKSNYLRATCISARAESNARYFDELHWRQKAVHLSSNNAVGYLHIPAMNSRGFALFTQAFLQESQCKGLIIDVRGNIGGNTSEQVLEKLNKRIIATCHPKFGRPSSYPIIPSGMVVLVDECTSSDAEVFAHSFRALGLGTVVGTTTWGGVMAISVSTYLVDMSYITHPSIDFSLRQENLRLENTGVEPDFSYEEVPTILESLTGDKYFRSDPQLEFAVSELEKLLKTHIEKHSI